MRSATNLLRQQHVYVSTLSVRTFLITWLVSTVILGAWALYDYATAGDNRETVDAAPYIYGQNDPISLGEIKNPESAYIHLKLRFRADSTDSFPNVFSTAPVNSGMRMELSGTSAGILIPDSSAPGGLKGFNLTSTLKLKQWYELEVEILNRTFIKIFLDGQSVADYASAGIFMETSHLLMGGGFDASRAFRGQIENISITKGNLKAESPGVWYAFYSALLIGLIMFILKVSQVNGAVVYARVAVLSIGAGFLYYAYSLGVSGYLPSPFLSSKSQTFMDLFNPLYWAYNDGRYMDWGSIYPPLNFWILRVFNFAFLGEVNGTAYVMRANSPLVIIGFVLVYLAVPIAVIKTKLWEPFPTSEKILIYCTTILSAPMLFALERGNLIILCPVLLALLLSRIGFLRCLSIAFLINIKPYFALLMVYYIARKSWKWFAICAALSGFIFWVSGQMLDDHFLMFFSNLFNFSQQDGIFSFKEMMALPSSISVFAYALKSPETAIYTSAFLWSAINTGLVFLVEILKWSVLAISLVTLFKRSSVMVNAEIFALLVVVITNLGVWVGGYTLILYVALIPVFMQMRAKLLYIGILLVLAMPIDIIPLLHSFIGEQHSYLTDANVNVHWTLGLGSIIRPVANLSLLLLLSWEFISRRPKKNSENFLLLRAQSIARHVQRFFAKTSFYIGMGSVFFAVLLYNGIYFNKYLPITEGWFSAYAHLIRQGLVPYLDFYLFMTPLFPLQIAAFQSVFGESFIALRMLGVVVILCLSFFLYLILARRFSPLVSVIATVTAIFYYQSGVAHITYDFIQFFSVLVLAATYLIILYADKKSESDINTRKHGTTLLLLAGILVSLAFLTKQSNGALVVVFSVGAVALATAGQNLLWRLKNLSMYMLGMAFPVLIMGIWLYFVDALLPFFDQVLFGAIDAKGSIWVILFSWVGRHANRDYLDQLIVGLLYISPLLTMSFIGSAIVKWRKNGSENQTRVVLGIFLFLALFCMAIGLAYYGIVTSSSWMITPGIKLSQGLVPISTALVLALTISPILQSFTGFRIQGKYLSIIAIMTLGLVFGNGTSAGIGEVSIFLGFALALGFLISLPNTNGVTKTVMGLACLSFILFLANGKFRQPYAWWYVSVPDIRESTTRPALPLLNGFRLSADTTKTLEETARIIQTHSLSGDDVYVFPHIPGLYVLADRWPHSKVLVSWFDFLPDKFAKAEAARLRTSPPQIIVNLKLPEAVWTAHESLFREGQPLGQRDIRAVIMELTEDRKLYQLGFSHEISPGSVLDVWHKRIR
jgi:hypothetical protein